MKKYCLFIILCLSCIALNAQRKMEQVDFYYADENDIPYFNDVYMKIIDENCFVEVYEKTPGYERPTWKHVADGNLKNFDISTFDNGYMIVRENHLLGKDESCLVEIYEKGKFVEVVSLPVALMNYPDVQRYFLGRNEHGYSTRIGYYGECLCQYNGYWGRIWVNVRGKNGPEIYIKLFDNNYPIDRYKAQMYENAKETIKFIDRYTGEKYLNNEKSNKK